MIKVSGISPSQVMLFGPYTHPVLSGSSSVQYFFNHNKGVYVDLIQVYYASGASNEYAGTPDGWQNTSGTYFGPWTLNNISKIQASIYTYRMNSIAEPIFFKLFFLDGRVI